MSTLHPLVSQLKQLLTSKGVIFETFEHALVHTSEEAALVRPGYKLEDSVTSLIVRVKSYDDERHFAFIVLRGGKRVDNQALKRVLHAQDIRFATPEEFADITHAIQIGGLPPFGNLFYLETFVDADVLTMPKIVFSAGDPCYSIAMPSADMIRSVHPHIARFST